MFTEQPVQPKSGWRFDSPEITEENPKNETRVIHLAFVIFKNLRRRENGRG